jgi:hypothetical protein
VGSLFSRLIPCRHFCAVSSSLQRVCKKGGGDLMSRCVMCAINFGVSFLSVEESGRDMPCDALVSRERKRSAAVLAFEWIERRPSGSSQQPAAFTQAKKKHFKVSLAGISPNECSVLCSNSSSFVVDYNSTCLAVKKNQTKKGKWWCISRQKSSAFDARFVFIFRNGCTYVTSNPPSATQQFCFLVVFVVVCPSFPPRCNWKSVTPLRSRQ